MTLVILVPLGVLQGNYDDDRIVVAKLVILMIVPLGVIQDNNFYDDQRVVVAKLIN